LSANLQQVQLSAASSLQKYISEKSRLEGTVENFKAELAESRHQLKSMEHELLQREDELMKASADLKTSQDDCFSKSKEVFSFC